MNNEKTLTLGQLVRFIVILIAVMIPGLVPLANTFLESLRDSLPEVTDALDLGEEENNAQESAQAHNPEPTTDQTVQQAPSATGKVNPNEVLSNGQEMRELQSLLLTLGFDPKGVDGKFGNGTSQAITQFQVSRAVPVNGQPTRGVLILARKSVANIQQLNTKADTALDEKAVRECVGDKADADTSGLAVDLMEQLENELSSDMKSYLVGLCLPTDKEQLRQAYLYLIAKGSIHARYTHVYYAELLSVYRQAGIDITVRGDAFRRSVELLDKDLSVLADDRLEGVERLVENYAAADAEAQRLLTEFVKHEKKLRGKYQSQAKELVSQSASHSASASFFLARSLYTGKRLFTFLGIDFPERSQNNFSLWTQHLFRNLGKNLNLVMFILRKRDALYDMTTASINAVNVLTFDIESVGEIKVTPAAAEDDVRRRREKNGVKLIAFEREFEEEQVRAQSQT